MVAYNSCRCALEGWGGEMETGGRGEKRVIIVGCGEVGCGEDFAEVHPTLPSVVDFGLGVEEGRSPAVVERGG